MSPLYKKWECVHIVLAVLAFGHQSVLVFVWDVRIKRTLMSYEFICSGKVDWLLHKTE